MRLTYALLPQRPATSTAITTLTVTLSPNATVSDLTTAILATHAARTQDYEVTFELYLIPVASHTHQQGAWLPRTKLALLDAAIVETHGTRLDADAALPLSQHHGLLGDDFKWREDDIHVVAVVTNHVPPAKRARTTKKMCAITRPEIIFDRYSVPLDTIDAFRAVQAALKLRELKPMVLLCGPPVSGKTKIANRVYHWLCAATEREDRGVSVDVRADHLVSDTAMWTMLGQCLDPDLECVDKASFVHACADLPTQWFFVMDNLLRLLAKPDLTSQFLDALRELRQLPKFGGIVGVGLDNAMMQSLPHASNELFSEDAVVHVKPLSPQQITDLLQQMIPLPLP